MKKFYWFTGTAIIVFLWISCLGYRLYLETSQKIEKTSYQYMGRNVPDFIYSYQCTYSRCDIYISSAIYQPDAYAEIYKVIETADKNQVIYLHLSGEGGDFRTVYRFADAINNSNSHVYTSVEGNALSAHAYIALLGEKVKISANSAFLFHVMGIKVSKEGDTLIYNKDICVLRAGHMDRGQDSIKKCEDLVQSDLNIFDSFFNKYNAPYFTQKEKSDLYAGYDVIISGQEMAKRLANKKL